ncbi:MAG TPA: FAD-binding oxidoreductase [Anaerolineaceae bacterium]|nr:FAD-binding oxidoreductase [Anaerolineaceae bacterium]
MPVQILSDPQIIQPYLSDESKVTGQAQSISFPECEAEIREVLLAVRQAHQTLTVQGARTGITGGAVPTGGHILNLSKLNRITGMAWDAERKCFLLSVQPGVQLNQLNKAIAEKSFDTTGWSAQAQSALRRFQQSGAWFLPADITETTASIGGMVSTTPRGQNPTVMGLCAGMCLGYACCLPTARALACAAVSNLPKVGSLHCAWMTAVRSLGSCRLTACRRSRMLLGIMCMKTWILSIFSSARKGH